MIKTRKLNEISKIKGLKLNKKYREALNHILMSLDDWGYGYPETLDLFLNEMKQFLEKEEIYLNDIKQFFQILIDRDEVLDYAWEVEALSSMESLFTIFGDNLHLEQIFSLISNYFENKTNLIIKNLKGNIVIRSKDKKSIEYFFRNLRKSTKQRIYCTKGLDDFFDIDKNIYNVEIYGELVFKGPKNMKEKCINLCKKIINGNWITLKSSNDKNNFYFAAYLKQAEKTNELIESISIIIN